MKTLHRGTGCRACIPPIAIAAALLAATGCHHAAARRDRVQRELTHHSQALTAAVVDTLELQPEPQRDPHSSLALELAREDQRIEGLPAEPIAVPLLLATNMDARAELDARFGRIRQQLDRQRHFDQRLIDRGATWENEQRARQLRWTKWLGGGSMLVGGAIALCVFFPVIIPIFGRILAWLAAKLPSAASALGVVSIKAFDAVVRGVEKARTSTSASSSASRLHNGPENFGPPAAEPLASQLDLHLAREMDADHKALVRARKAALKL